MRAATQAEANRFKARMAERFHAREQDKSKAAEMAWLAQGFDVARTFGAAVPAGHVFATYATTLGPIIYLPEGLSPDEQIDIFTHEIEHVRQFWAHGFEFAWLYLTAPEARARYEAEAFTQQFKLRYARTGRLPTLDEVSFPLEQGYALPPGDVALGLTSIEQWLTSIAAGLIVGEVSAEAIRILKGMDPDLLTP